MEQAVEQVRWRDTIGTVEPGTIPWEITTPEGKPIEWDVAISLPGPEPSIWVFAALDDVEFAIRDGEVPLSEEDEQWLKDVIDRNPVASPDDREPSPEEREQLHADFLAFTEAKGLAPDSDAAFDAAVEAGLLDSVCLYDAAGSWRLVTSYVSDIRTAFPYFKPVALSTSGVTRIWSWPNGKSPPDLSVIDPSRYFAMKYTATLHRIDVPFEIRSIDTR